jgi:hypothetical protein
MVTSALALALLAPVPAGARKLSSPLDLFGIAAPRHRGTAHAAKMPAPVPLPKPRPADAPAAPQETSADKSAEDKPAPEKQTTEKPAQSAAPAEKPVSACRQALTGEIAIAPSVPDIHGPGGCGGEDLVRLEAVVLPDKRRVAVKPAAILRCTMASAIADWVRTDMVPVAASLGTTISDLDNFDSFECRGRNRIVGAMLSEHGKANALDVRAIKLANGQSIGLTDRTISRELREHVLHSVCARFTTVLGPGSDWYHEDHIHLDLAQRRNDYRICQWNVWDPLPQAAPLLPAERPDEAPPRELAGKSDGKPDGRSDGRSDGKSKPDATKEVGDEPDAAEPDKPAPAPAVAEPAKKPPTKKRR